MEMQRIIYAGQRSPYGIKSDNTNSKFFFSGSVSCVFIFCYFLWWRWPRSASYRNMCRFNSGVSIVYQCLRWLLLIHVCTVLLQTRASPAVQVLLACRVSHSILLVLALIWMAHSGLMSSSSVNSIMTHFCSCRITTKCTVSILPSNVAARSFMRFTLRFYHIVVRMGTNNYNIMGFRERHLFLPLSLSNYWPLLS